ncbi:MAG: hypothetical protein LC624_11160 [Halobacteriales archaeon]|nr:hypothetical protein [Halobacteriales archaeon]
MPAKKDVAASYNKLKEFEGKKYTGMRVGGTHTWLYNDGLWKERKVAPDRWEIMYTSAKRRKGHAPEGSGAPVGTEYHWYILAHQFVKKLDANTYDTFLEGAKYKLAHKRAASPQWSTELPRAPSDRKRLIGILEDTLERLREDTGEPEDDAAAPALKPRKADLPPAEAAPKGRARRR